MTHFIPHENFGVNLIRNRPDGQLHAQRHLDICRALDMTKLGIVLDEMVKTGFLSPLQRNAFHAQAGGLLAVMLAENARSFLGSSAQSTLEQVQTYTPLTRNETGAA